VPEKQLPTAGVKTYRKGQWLPGQSGNPNGLAVVKIRKQQRLRELFDALVADFPDATAAEIALLQQAAALLYRSERQSIRIRYWDGDVAIRCASGAKRLLMSLHRRRCETGRETALPPPPSPWSPMRSRAGLCEPTKEPTG
jgi:hypothetical protein